MSHPVIDCPEFDCCECGRHIVQVAPGTPPDPRLCVACLTVPGWLRIPAFRAALGLHDHDGLEVVERLHPEVAHDRG